MIVEVPAWDPRCKGGLRRLGVASRPSVDIDRSSRSAAYLIASAAVLRAFLSTNKGPEGWAAELEMAADPLFDHIGDRTKALAVEKAAEEADGMVFTEFEFAILDKTGETPPATREAMFALMRDRLDDIDDLLFQDISPRELWKAPLRSRQANMRATHQT